MSLNNTLATAQNFINNNTTVQTVVLHALIGSTLLYHTAKIPGVWSLNTLYLIFLVLTSVKEFYWDKHFESPKQSFLGSLYDWIGWQVGATLAYVFVALGV